MTAAMAARRTQRRRSQRVARSLNLGRRRAGPVSFERLRARATRDGDCLLAPGRVDLYGKVWIDGRCVGAHRVAYTLANGPIAAGTWILHRCLGRKACIAEEHLYAGDASANNRDTLRAGRAGRKLTPGAVLVIRAAPRTHNSRIALAEALNVTPGHVRAVQDRRAWAWLPAEMAAT